MRKSAKVVAGIFISVFFLWLVFRNIEFSEVLHYMQGITYWWLIPYFFVSLLSHFLRSERWRMLVQREHNVQHRDTLFAGVMLGYLVNYAVPRLGEISRSVYVAKKSDMSTSDVIGTVVLERIIDFACMLLMTLIVVFFIITDLETIQRVFGQQAVDFLAWMGELQQIATFALIMIAAAILVYALYLIINRWRKQSSLGKKIALRIENAIRQFIYGLTSILRLKNWPLFLLSTVLIWLCYAAMSYIPFIAFDLVSEHGLGFYHAWVVMVISAIGVSLPSPGGIGTYHWFVMQTLVVLYSVPATVALAYAFVTHAVMMIIVIIITPVIIFFNTGGKFSFDIFKKTA